MALSRSRWARTVPVEARAAEAVDQVDRGLEPQHLREPEERPAVRRPVPGRVHTTEPLPLLSKGNKTTRVVTEASLRVKLFCE